MRLCLRYVLFAALAMLSIGPSVRACINDREVNNAEREFKSQYPIPSAPDNPAPPSPSVSPSDAVKEYGPLAAGGVLLLGAVFQGHRRARAK